MLGHLAVEEVCCSLECDRNENLGEGGFNAWCMQTCV
jgi:hypothetical protein